MSDQENPDGLEGAATEPIGCGRCDPYTAHLLGDAGLYGETCADIGCTERTWRLLPRCTCYTIHEDTNVTCPLNLPDSENTAEPKWPTIDPLVLPIYEWNDHRRDGVGLYVVVNTPGSPGMFLWNGRRWIDLDFPENTASPEVTR